MPVVFGQLVLVAVIGYLWGSLPPGYWAGKIMKGKDFDIRDYGSHKTGATNVNRVLGKGPAAVVFVLDLSKGIAPVLLAQYVPFLHGMGWGPAVAGLAALLGHRAPIFIGFQGGRGVLTGAGAMLVISLPASALIFLIGLIATMGTIALSRYVSLGSLIGCLTVAVCGVIFFINGWINLPGAVFMVLAAMVVMIFHYDNIGRLLTGKERKLGQKEAVNASPTPGATRTSTSG